MWALGREEALVAVGHLARVLLWFEERGNPVLERSSPLPSVEASV